MIVDFSLEPRVFINLLQNLTCLEELSLEFVRISSSLPTHPNISSSLKLLNLQYTGFHGKLPHSFFNLQSLEKLDLSRNSFTGQIPWEISLLPRLVSLDLSLNNNLRIEPHIFNRLLQNSTLLRDLIFSDVNIGLFLPTYLNVSFSLKSLDLRNTSLKGKLCDNVFNFRHLESLDLSGNTNLIGQLPKVNDTIPLERLSLSTCGLTGPIPASIGNLRHLTFLDLSSNKLNGTLPLVIPQSLEQLFLDDNQFHGQIDVFTFEQLTNLNAIYLSHNNFSGDWELDTLLSNLKNLEILDLSYCGLFVTTSNANQSNHHANSNLRSLYMASCKINVFPESLRSMKNLRFLDLSSNEIHGQIPHWAGEIGGSKLTYFNLSHNFITGLPQFQWYGLLALYLQSNLIQGPFHPSICNMRNLVNLDLSNNRFDGVIPQCFGNITSSLHMINLGKNHFQGTIPNVYENCGGLEGLILNENQFEGEVPSSLSKCQSLKVLDMGNNQLNGTFPYWLESLPNLQVLVLKSNGFHGCIKPSSIVGLTFPTLQVIDLSHNRFEGQIPRKYFKNFNAMKNGVKRSTTPEYVSAGGLLYSFIVTAKGAEQEFPQLYVYYTIVCLSHNKFVGEIPDIIGNLNSLVVVDLSHNSLTGQIPHTLGKLSEIESLDLSCNQLTGKIPQSLVDLTFLGFLNLSQNHLVGLIPVGKQFNTFQENSFEGNPNLCGLPLPKKCNGYPQLEGDGDGDGEKSGFTWKVVMLGYGCGTLFGLVIGYLMLTTRRPRWFNAIADAMEQMILKRGNNKRYIYIGR
uniref:receptor-like protein 36 n=1 Tax=Erigeron canadensis TaxID=72917 RepID=UPI001CB8C96C|nr:receptor-like protein 36 [Erigeron canadensis]